MTPGGCGVIVTDLISARLYHCRFASVKQSADLTSSPGFDLPIGGVQNLFDDLSRDVVPALQIVLHRPDRESRPEGKGSTSRRRA